MTYRCLVSGYVQGVWFRGTTRDKALSLGLVGYAKNLPDGFIEIVASGDQKSLDSLAKWLWQGPQMARVEEVKCEQLPQSQDYLDFKIL